MLWRKNWASLADQQYMGIGDGAGGKRKEDEKRNFKVCPGANLLSTRVARQARNGSGKGGAPSESLDRNRTGLVQELGLEQLLL